MSQPTENCDRTLRMSTDLRQIYNLLSVSSGGVNIPADFRVAT
jgi:hypothetical protein